MERGGDWSDAATSRGTGEPPEAGGGNTGSSPGDVAPLTRSSQTLAS